MELEIGQYYTACKGIDNYIFIFKGFQEESYFLINNTNLIWYNHNSSNYYSNSYLQIEDKHIKKQSTPIEIQWLDECIAARRKVEKPKHLTKPTLWL